jgi:hypothetical protein
VKAQKGKQIFKVCFQPLTRWEDQREKSNPSSRKINSCF